MSDTCISYSSLNLRSASPVNPANTHVWLVHGSCMKIPWHHLDSKHEPCMKHTWKIHGPWNDITVTWQKPPYWPSVFTSNTFFAMKSAWKNAWPSLVQNMARTWKLSTFHVWFMHGVHAWTTHTGLAGYYRIVSGELKRTWYTTLGHSVFILIPYVMWLNKMLCDWLKCYVIDLNVMWLT